MDAELRPFNNSVRTIQIAEGAVELETPKKLALGEVIGLGFGEKKARFRVLSQFISGPNSYRAILECTSNECMWRAEMLAPDEQSAGRQERRRSGRYPATGVVTVLTSDASGGAAAKLVDVSDHGCYAESYSPAPVGTTLQLQITAYGTLASATAIVRTMHPAIGMGLELIEFASLTDQVEFGKMVTAAQNP